MTRPIDKVINYVKALQNDYQFSPVIKQVIINRLNESPTQQELILASEQVLGKVTNPWFEGRSAEEIENTAPDD